MELKIKFQESLTEFELQAELYMDLKNLGYQVKGEIVDNDIKNHTNNKKGFRQSRFDIVVFHKKEARIIIEVKKPGKKFNLFGRQNQKYNMYRIPILYFNDLKKKDFIIREVESILKG